MKTYITASSPAGSPPGSVLVERRLTSLDGWRGVAILLVFVRHYFLTTQVHSRLIEGTASLASAGWIGVDLFFVLSGFLITGILLDTRGHRHYFRNFYARRTLRIFPLYYGVLFGALALTPLLHLHWQAGDVTHFLYVDNISVQFNPALTRVPPRINLDVMWSLAVEEQFYLLWPAIILLIATRKPLRWIGGFMGLALLLRVGLLFLLPAERAFRLVNSAGLMRWLQAHLHSQALGGIAYVIVSFVAVTAAAVASYELYEKHFLKLKRRFSYSAEPVAAGS